jgi:hypothetical protein
MEDLTGKSSKGTRQERLTRMLADKTERLPFLEQDAENDAKDLVSAESGGIHDFFSERDPEGPIRERFDVLLGEMIDICQRVEDSATPVQEVQRVIEIVLQRGVEWAESEEGMEDSRPFLLTVALQDLYPQRFTYSTPMPVYFNELLARRNDHEFLKKMAARLPETRLELERHRVLNQRNTEMYREAKAKSPGNLQAITGMYARNAAHSESRLNIVRRHAAKIEHMLKVEKTENEAIKKEEGKK